MCEVVNSRVELGGRFDIPYSSRVLGDADMLTSPYKAVASSTT